MSMTQCMVKILIALSVVTSASRAEQPEKILKTIDGSIDTRKDTQKKAGEWQSEKERLKSRYYQLKDTLETKDLEVQHLKDVIARQKTYIERTQRKIIEMERIRQQLVPFLTEVVDTLNKEVQKDLPFLMEERTSRIAALKAIIHDPEVTMGEKIRRVFEGLRVEMDFGKSVETTKEEIEYQGQKRLVKVFRLGRTALLAQTLDEKEIAIYDGSGWSPLPGNYKPEIKKAIDISERRRPIEFVNLPVRRTSP